MPKLQRTTKVGSYKPNDWGLYDMHGNVAEWCEDWYDAKAYGGHTKQNPTGPKTGKERVLRGGSLHKHANSCRAAARLHANPTDQKDHTGFRVVCVFAK